jgi:hypothetical protein
MLPVIPSLYAAIYVSQRRRSQISSAETSPPRNKVRVEIAVRFIVYWHHEENLIAARNPLDHNVNNDSPSTAELQFGIPQKNISASGNTKRDDNDGFIDINELLAFTQEETISVCVEPNPGSRPETDDDESRGCSPVSSSCSTLGSSEGRAHLRFLLSRDC